MKSAHQQRVEEFMRKGGQEIPDRPSLPHSSVAYLRAKLALEEALETIHALGYAVCQRRFEQDLSLDNCTIYRHTRSVRLEKIADGCADMIVVATGTLSACGIHDVELLAEVDRSNLTKVAHGVIRGPGGKILKPRDYHPPRIGQVLKNQK